MTKAIKFNLFLDNHPVRDLDDLRAHFNIDDLLTLYHDKVLHRWLDVRGLNDELKQVMAINSNDNKMIAKTLCQIFHSNVTAKDMEAAVYPFEFRQEQKQQLEKLNGFAFKRNELINDYHAGYEKLCADMLSHAEDYPFLKSAINTLWQDYSQLFTVDFAVFFAKFIEKSPLTLFSMLGNDVYKESILFDEYRKRKLFGNLPKKLDKYQKDTNCNWEEVSKSEVTIKGIGNPSGKVKVKDNYGREYDGTDAVDKVLNGLYFCSLNSYDYVQYVTSSLLSPAYKFYAGVTDNYWKDLEPKGKKCLILKMENSNFIRNSGKSGEELNANDINGQFIILDGIDYKSNNADHTLIYMVI